MRAVYPNYTEACKSTWVFIYCLSTRQTAIGFLHYQQDFIEILGAPDFQKAVHAQNGACMRVKTICMTVWFITRTEKALSSN